MVFKLLDKVKERAYVLLTCGEILFYIGIIFAIIFVTAFGR